MRSFQAWIAVALLAACASSGATSLALPARLSPDTLRVQAQTVAGTWTRAHPAEQLPWSWSEGALAYGLWQLYRSNGDEALRSYLARYVARHQAATVRIASSDDAAPGLVAAELVLAGDDSVRPLVDRVVQYIMKAPRTHAQGLLRHLGQHLPAWLAPRAWYPDAWVDTLFHVTLTLCRYTRITGDAQYRDEAARQLAAFLRNLQDPETGFVTHAYNDRPRDERMPAFRAQAYWARGNGWALVSLVEVLRELPAAHPLRRTLAARAQRLASALMSTQSDRGLFHTVLLDADSYEETAGSALISYGLMLGAKDGLFGTREAAVASFGVRGLVSTLAQRGDALEVRDISEGTNPFSSARRYANVARASQLPHGVGAWLLAVSAALGSAGRVE